MPSRLDSSTSDLGHRHLFGIVSKFTRRIVACGLNVVLAARGRDQKAISGALRKRNENQRKAEQSV